MKIEEPRSPGNRLVTTTAGISALSFNLSTGIQLDSWSNLVNHLVSCCSTGVGGDQGGSPIGGPISSRDHALHKVH